MIDFGLSQHFINKCNEHIKDNKPSNFKGSLLFASKNAHQYVKTSRRDDLISLVYLLIYLLDKNRLVFSEYCDDARNIKLIGKMKSKLDAKDLCGSSMSETRAYSIKNFVQEVMSY